MDSLLQVGCHTEEADEGTSLIQCVCSTDFCNGPHSTLDLIHISKSHKFIQNWFFIVAQILLRFLFIPMISV